MFKRIYLDDPNLGKSEKRYLNKTINSGFVSTAGPFVPEFEQKFAEYLKVKKAVSTQSGTQAIHMALYELGICRGDEVIVPALTFVATVNPVMYVGATPVFADVDMDTWNISPSAVEKKITRKTKAVIPVHFYGNPCRMDEIMRIARKHNIYVIEDATESIGARYDKRHTGTFGDLGCFSFNGNKIITTGGGGMVAGRNKKSLEHIKFLVNQGKNGSEGYYHPEIGFNYRMTNLEAALGLAQMERLNAFLAKKKDFINIYREELEKINFIHFQEEYEKAESSRWLSCIIFDKKVNISLLQRKLNSEKIPTRRIFMPITEFPPFKRYKKENYANSYRIYERGLCMPSSTLNSRDNIHYVCDKLKKII